MSDATFHHFIDFWVILFADVGAAFVAVALFEAKKADRERCEESLNQLFQLADHFEKYYRRELAKVPMNNNLSHQIASYIDDESRSLEGLDSNILFWRFVGGKRFRHRYQDILKSRRIAHQGQPSAELRGALQKLISQFCDLKSEIENKLNARSRLLRLLNFGKDE